MRYGRQRWRGTGGLGSSVYSYGDMNERLLSPQPQIVNIMSTVSLKWVIF